HRWQRNPGITLLGDAAHLAPPDGEGANLAMFDGAELGKAIASHRDDAESALAEFEQAMFARSASAGVEALKTFELCFNDERAPYGLLDRLSGVSAPPAS
ncbi:MAG TPA: FAD-dependent monooxygenase, partial [Polyangiaceae bacterium]